MEITYAGTLIFTNQWTSEDWRLFDVCLSLYLLILIILLELFGCQLLYLIACDFEVGTKFDCQSCMGLIFIINKLLFVVYGAFDRVIECLSCVIYWGIFGFFVAATTRPASQRNPVSVLWSQENSTDHRHPRADWGRAVSRSVCCVVVLFFISLCMYFGNLKSN